MWFPVPPAPESPTPPRPDPAPAAGRAPRRRMCPWIVLVLAAILFVNLIYEGITAHFTGIRLRQKAQAQAVALLWHQFVDVNCRSPASLEELEQFAKTDPRAAADIRKLEWIVGEIRQERFLLIWNADFGPESFKKDAVLGFDADAERSGGMVMLAEGSVRWMTVEEFRAASHIPVASPDPIGLNAFLRRLKRRFN
jgi:hypothetical protein